MSARNRRLPRHRAWPLTTTDINECLGAHLDRVTDLRFLTGHDSGTIVLGVEWVAPEPFNYGHGIHPDAVGFRIDVPAVDATERAATRALLKAHALPQLHEWVTQAIAADETWRQTPHLHYWRLTGGHLTHRDEA
ncbi:hypothetical protein OHA79_48250 (plasmid) [Streptomyces sp. NBC_00841]|uniref:hypothetical protein n=1 Tax=unclassified Streptomyces TaxID=2593676 RepID=UPI0022520DE9|nr:MULTISPECIES: hypothetical protein [unclassified Streptomyces]MCX4538861.1 hypothetical protein [Streptomyces sp. NBC_01669]WSA05346.1 hypothetical protein OHA79_48250 [Streptomyces sp. NBC_00841]